MDIGARPVLHDVSGYNLDLANFLI